jgi:hypothetical protein
MVSNEVKEAIDLFNMNITNDKETNEYLLKNIMVKLNHPDVNPNDMCCIENLFGTLGVIVAETCESVPNYWMLTPEDEEAVDSIEIIMDYMAQEFMMDEEAVDSIWFKNL